MTATFSFQDGTDYAFMDGTTFDFMGAGASSPINVDLGLLEEAEQLFAFILPKNIELGLVQEGEELFGISAAFSYSLGLIEEAEQLFEVRAGFSIPMGLVEEEEQLFSWTRATTRARYNLFFEEHLSPIRLRGKIILNRPIQEGEQLLVLRNTPVYSAFEAEDGKPFPTEQWEYMLDKACYIEQELEGHLCACPAYPDYPGIPPLPDSSDDLTYVGTEI